MMILSAGLISCEYDSSTSPKKDMETEITPNTDMSDLQIGTTSIDAIEQRLEHFAISLAKTLEVPEVATFLKNQIGVKFDGDYNVLWNAVKGHSFSGHGSLRGIIASNLKERNGVSHSMDDIENIPKLQIALPVGFNDWDGISPILVAYVPLSIDDTEAVTVNAYDAAGNEYLLDAQTPPNFPVMVVGINERTDDEGNLTKLTCCDGGGGGGGGPPPHNQGDMEILEKMYLIHDNEPWFWGSPEIYVIIGKDFGPNPFLFLDYPNVNNENQLYTLNTNIFNWYTSQSGNYIVVAVLESDIFGGFSITNASPGVQTIITATGSDDMLGFTNVLFTDVPQEYHLKDVRIWMDYN